MEFLPAPIWRRRERPTDRLGRLEHRCRDLRSGLHDGDALVPWPSAPDGAATARPLPRGAAGQWRERLRPSGPGRGLSSVGALVDHKTSVEVAWIVKTP